MSSAETAMPSAAEPVPANAPVCAALPKRADIALYVVAVGPRGCGKTTALHAMLGAASVSRACSLRSGDVLTTERRDAMLRDVKCPGLIVEGVVSDGATRDAVAHLVRTHRHTQKSVYQEVQSVFAVPRRLRHHADVVLVFKNANDDERRRVFRHFAHAYYASEVAFATAMNALDHYEYIVLERNCAPRVHKVTTVPPLSDSGANASSPSSWLWRLLGY